MRTGTGIAIGRWGGQYRQPPLLFGDQRGGNGPSGDSDGEIIAESERDVIPSLDATSESKVREISVLEREQLLN